MTKLGKIVFTLVVLLLAGFAVSRLLKKADEPQSGPPPVAEAKPQDAAPSSNEATAAFDFVAPGKAPQLPSPRTYTPQGDTILINLSEYPGYAGLIMANGASSRVTTPGSPRMPASS